MAKPKNHHLACLMAGQPCETCPEEPEGGLSASTDPDRPWCETCEDGKEIARLRAQLAIATAALEKFRSAMMAGYGQQAFSHHDANDFCDWLQRIGTDADAALRAIKAQGGGKT